MRTPFKFLLGAVWFALLLVYGTGMVAACSVERLPVPWVLTTPQFDTSVLPDAITMSYRKVESWGDGELLLTNSSTTPLYVLAKADDGFDGTRPSAGVPAGQLATLKVSQNLWSERRGSRWTTLSTEEAPRDAWTATLSALDIDTHSQSYDERPDDFVVPPTLHTTIALLYGGQVLDVPTTVAFALNPIPESKPAPRIDPCAPPPRAERYLPWLALLVTGIAGVVGVSLFRASRMT